MTANRRTVAAPLTLSGLVTGVWLVSHPPEWLSQIGTIALVAVTWLLFAVGAWLVLREPARVAAGLILVGGIALPLAAGFAPPHTSDDLYRYQWDGRVQAAGIDPYRYAPAAPELTPLRDRVLWPDQASWCVAPATTDHETNQPLTPGCTHINRPAVHTIYPPVAQAYFWLVHILSPPDAGTWPIQFAAALCAIVTTLLLLTCLPRLGIDRRRAVLWAWCPTVAFEAGNNAHIDVLAALFTAAALITLATAHTRPRAALAGALLGLATATKLTPALVLPTVARRRPLTVIAAATGAVALVYLPHLLTVGAAVIGYIPGYLSEEGYADGTRFALLTLILPTTLAAPIAVTILATVGLAVARTTDPDRPWRGAVVMTGTALLITTPGYSWYAVLLVLLVALDGRAEWLTVAVAGYVALYAHDLHLTSTLAQQIGYGAALLCIVAATLVRRRTTRPLRPRRPDRPGRRIGSMGLVGVAPPGDGGGDRD
jgi:hypothetical protein